MSPTQGHPRPGGGCATNTAFRQRGAADMKRGVTAIRPDEVRRTGSPCLVTIRRRGRQAQIEHGTWDPWIDPHPGKKRAARARAGTVTTTQPTHRDQLIVAATSPTTPPRRCTKAPKHTRRSPATDIPWPRSLDSARLYLRNHGVRAIDHAPDGPSYHPADCMTQGSSVEWAVAFGRDRWNTTGKLTSRA